MGKKSKRNKNRQQGGFVQVPKQASTTAVATAPAPPVVHTEPDQVTLPVDVTPPVPEVTVRAEKPVVTNDLSILGQIVTVAPTVAAPTPAEKKTEKTMNTKGGGFISKPEMTTDGRYEGIVTQNLFGEKGIHVGWQIQSGNTRFSCFKTAQPAGFTLEVGQAVTFQKAATTQESAGKFRAVDVRPNTSVVAEAMQKILTAKTMKPTVFKSEQLVAALQRNYKDGMTTDELLATMPVFAFQTPMFGYEFFFFVSEDNTSGNQWSPKVLSNK